MQMLHWRAHTHTCQSGIPSIGAENHKSEEVRAEIASECREGEKKNVATARMSMCQLSLDSLSHELIRTEVTSSLLLQYK